MLCLNLGDKLEKVSQDSGVGQIGDCGKAQVEVCAVPEHLGKLEEIGQICLKSRGLLLKSGRFKWSKEFRNIINVQVIQTNFESIRALLHFGNFQMTISVIYTQIEEKIISRANSKAGSFGLKRLSVKAVKLEYSHGDIDTKNAYQEFFMCSVADVLGVGPKIFALFGYDILITKNMIFFAMEKCQPSKLQSINIIQQELLQNLRTIHSLQFIHGDIKPENVAFSSYSNKHIFIDFGLSRFITQPPGQKTKTKFSGTLNYCSDEMKKCYVFSMAKFVDLYQNDLCCFRRSLANFQYLLKVEKFLIGANFYKEQELEENNMEDILSQIIAIMRLKYCFETSNVSEILKTIQRKSNMRAVFYQIFNTSQVPSAIAENKQLKDRLQAIKNQLFSKDYKITKTTNIFSEFFSEEKRMVAIEKIVPVSQILQSKSQFFDRYLSKPQLILKLFHFFQPFSNPNLNPHDHLPTLKRKIVQKIYETNPRKFPEPIFFSQKLRYTLLFFFQNLKHLKNLKSMLALRLLFISIEEWESMKEVQLCVIWSVQGVFFKFLVILEFLFFRGLLMEGSESGYDDPWYGPIQQIVIDSHSEREVKVRQLVLMLKGKSRLFEQPFEFRASLVKLIEQISHFCQSEDQKQMIQKVKNMFRYLCRFSTSIFPGDAAQGLESKIYSRFESSPNIQPNPTSTQPQPQTQSQSQQQKLFYPTRLQLKQLSTSTTTPEPSPTLLLQKIQTQFLILQSRSILQTLFFQSAFQLGFNHKKYLYYFIELMKVELGRETGKEETCLGAYGVSGKLICFYYFLDLKEGNLGAIGDGKVGDQEGLDMVDDVIRVFQGFTNLEQHRVLIAQSQYLQIETLIIQVRLLLQKPTKPPKINQKIPQKFQTLSKLLCPLPHRHPNLVSHFLNLYTCLKPHILQDRTHFSKQPLFNIIQQYCRSGEFLIFCNKELILELFLTIKEEEGRGEGRGEEGLGLGLRFVWFMRGERLGERMRMDQGKEDKEDKEERHKRMMKARVLNRVFLCVVRVFCGVTSCDKLVEVYLRLRYKRQEMECGFYAFFVLSIFMQIRCKIPKADQLTQTLRSTLTLTLTQTLKPLPPIFQTLSKKSILLLHQPLLPTNPNPNPNPNPNHNHKYRKYRKYLIYRRQQLRTTCDPNKVKYFCREVGSRGSRFFGKGLQDVLGKFLAKVERYLEKVVG